MAAVTVRSDSEAHENKFVTVSTFSPSICHEVMGPDANPVTISKLPTWYLGLLTMELLLYWLRDVTF